MSTNFKPTSSPSSPEANFVGDLRHAAFLRGVDKISIAQAQEIAEILFEVFSECDDDKILSGKVDPSLVNQVEFSRDSTIVNPANLTKFTDICNSLFKLANDTQIGARINLSMPLVEDYDIRSAARIRCMGVRELGPILCDVVNEEMKFRRPDFVIVAKSARPLDDSSRDMNNNFS